MPMYDYWCAGCGGKLAIIRTMEKYQDPPSSDEEIDASMPVCNEGVPHKWERTIGPTSFKLLGYGWYKDGY